MASTIRSGSGWAHTSPDRSCACSPASITAAMTGSEFAGDADDRDRARTAVLGHQTVVVEVPGVVLVAGEVRRAREAGLHLGLAHREVQPVRQRTPVLACTLVPLRVEEHRRDP